MAALVAIVTFLCRRRRIDDFKLAGHLVISLLFGRCLRQQWFGITDKINSILGNHFAKSESDKLDKPLRCHCQVFNHQTPSLKMVPGGETSQRVQLPWLSSASLPSLCSRYLSPVPVCHTKCHHGHSSVHHPITIIILTFTIVDLHYISKCVCHLLLILIEVFSRKCRGNPGLKRERVLIQCVAGCPGRLW